VVRGCGFGLAARAAKNARGCVYIKTEYLLQSQLDLILAALVPDNRRVLQVMLRTGLRVGDVLELKRDQIGRQFWVTEKKTGKRKQCGLPDWLTREIKNAAGQSVWAFPSPYDERKHRTRQAVWKDLKRASLAFRIPVNVGTHSVRKMYAVDLMRKYGDIERVRKDLNHSSPSVTMLYAMADVLAVSAAQRKPTYKRRR
jgi:integrase